ncbi:MAG: hypothetical protein FJ217_03305, partial [Ignavibacteria bacterium]|nr:hypothetical protein [Ignavibacteria bacterium]
MQSSSPRPRHKRVAQRHRVIEKRTSSLERYTAMNYQTLLVEIRNRIAYVTINRPDKLNALNAQAKTELKQVFEGMQTDPSVDLVILTGA